MRKPNRYSAARDPHAAALRCPPRRTPAPRPSLPALRVLKWAAAAVAAVILATEAARFLSAI